MHVMYSSPKTVYIFHHWIYTLCLLPSNLTKQVKLPFSIQARHWSSIPIFWPTSNNCLVQLMLVQCCSTQHSLYFPTCTTCYIFTAQFWLDKLTCPSQVRQQLTHVFHVPGQTASTAYISWCMLCTARPTLCTFSIIEYIRYVYCPVTWLNKSNYPSQFKPDIDHPYQSSGQPATTASFSWCLFSVAQPNTLYIFQHVPHAIYLLPSSDWTS
jgi:hypothetical protein